MVTLAVREGEAKVWATIVYALYAALFFTGGISLILGVILAYVKHRAISDTWVGSHFDNQINICLGIFFGVAFGELLSIFLPGRFLILPLVGLWFVYRVIKGWTNLSRYKPYPPGFF